MSEKTEGGSEKKSEVSKPTQRFALSGIAIEGFKSIRERREMPLSALNVVAGANSSGKSSFMQPLLLLKQTLEAAFDP
ncbi:MAG: AAA family ATPase, partial [Rhodoferax sp.]|nr:AAA family ATPase [Rhodoferax sp.]